MEPNTSRKHRLRNLTGVKTLEEASVLLYFLLTSLLPVFEYIYTKLMSHPQPLSHHTDTIIHLSSFGLNLTSMTFNIKGYIHEVGGVKVVFVWDQCEAINVYHLWNLKVKIHVFCAFMKRLLSRWRSDILAFYGLQKSRGRFANRFTLAVLSKFKWRRDLTADPCFSGPTRRGLIEISQGLFSAALGERRALCWINVSSHPSAPGH